MVMSLFVRAVWSRRLSTLALMTLLLIGSASLAAGQGVEYLSGQNIAPVFEGWERQPYRSYDFIFGYFNRNLEEHFFLPLGTENQFEPGPADRGQPTFFYPRRSWFVFRINVPADFGSQELVWTLTSNGKTETATASLKIDYELDDTVIYHTNTGLVMTEETSRNLAPTLQVEGGADRSVSVGDRLRLAAVTTDDGIPSPRPAPRRVGFMTAMGHRLSWFVYRGDGHAVTFDPKQFKAYWDSRSNSPWTPGWKAPPVPDDGRVAVTATFNEPGRYILRVMAHDGASDTTRDISIAVESSKP